MVNDNLQVCEGGCACGLSRYRLENSPLFIHCCHCSRCQRESGAAFALNLLIESGQVTLLQGEVEKITVPTASGKGQVISRCTQCQVALWSNYAGAQEKINFVKVGTLDDAEKFAPDVHIYTSTKLPWITLTDGKPIYAEYYVAKEVWPQQSQERYRQALGK